MIRNDFIRYDKIREVRYVRRVMIWYDKMIDSRKDSNKDDEIWKNVIRWDKTCLEMKRYDKIWRDEIPQDNIRPRSPMIL